MSSLFAYWGKADPNYPGDQKWHPLVYHCLDVAAVAWAWLEVSPVVRTTFCRAFGVPPERFVQLRAWVVFFVALHDLGKIHSLFQKKLRDALGQLWPDADSHLDCSQVVGYFHGPEGYDLAAIEYMNWIGNEDEDYLHWGAWEGWIQAVTGHHGEIPEAIGGRGQYAGEVLMTRDRAARSEWVSMLAELILEPAGLTLSDLPPSCSKPAQTWLAGFCAVCDWIGSNTAFFEYRPEGELAAEYFKGRLRQVQAKAVLNHCGLVAEARPYAGLGALLGMDESARGVQTLIDQMPAVSGLTLIEAPTGSGKTEAALAYAWRLLEAGVAESVVFALPTQATANGMLPRAEAFSLLAFGVGNVVLAHGKRNLTPAFQRLVAAGSRYNAQGKEEATAQCAAWLAQSRKRVFLGQMGVCTVDQALLSVLPVRHKFVRGFGLQRAVLIVDEVHAYDSYMHGLLAEVLRYQQATGGSAILLSATLPSSVRGKLLQGWQGKDENKAESAPYPVVWWTDGAELTTFEVPPEHPPKERVVAVECIKCPDALPDAALMARIVAAARAGARVAVVMNLVDAAQTMARHLRELTDVPVDLFHARFRFRDRMAKETDTMTEYGRKRPVGGRILVATQVVEQSLDLDFDWLVTQICPADLLFQRLGRLHRHERPRPLGCEQPCCTVLSVIGQDFGSHKAIYGNTRVLWRTESLLIGSAQIRFPAAYRDWIEQVYESSPWDKEPGAIFGEYLAWRDEQKDKAARALQRARQSISQFRDSDEVTASLTRDGEMSLTVFPMSSDGNLLDGTVWGRLSERDQAEAGNLNTIPVPGSKKWKGALSDCTIDDEGRYRVVMQPVSQNAWISHSGKAVFRYSKDYGLERGSDESA